MESEGRPSEWSPKPSEKATESGKKSKPGKGKKGRPTSLEALKSSLPGRSDALDRIWEAVDRKLSGKMTHDQDNPFSKIVIDVPHYWDTEDTVLAFLEQFVGGYVWACKHDSSFVAVHEEAPRLQQLYDRVLAYKAMKADPERDEEEFYGQRFTAWCLVELATVLPSMWD